MPSIKIQELQETAQPIVVHELPADFNSAAQALRYFEEAENPNLPEYVAEAKRDTARFLAARALESQVKQYMGEEEASSR